MRPVIFRWKLCVLGATIVTLGTLVALLLYRYPVRLRIPTWAVYGACGAIVSLGMANVAQSLALRKTALCFFLAFLAGAFGIATWLALTKAIGQCASSNAGISMVSPQLLCTSAYGVGILGGAVVLSYVVAGALRRQNAA